MAHVYMRICPNNGIACVCIRVCVCIHVLSVYFFNKKEKLVLVFIEKLVLNVGILITFYFS